MVEENVLLVTLEADIFDLSSTGFYLFEAEAIIQEGVFLARSALSIVAVLLANCACLDASVQREIVFVLASLTGSIFSVLEAVID